MNYIKKLLPIIAVACFGMNLLAMEQSAMDVAAQQYMVLCNGEDIAITQVQYDALRHQSETVRNVLSDVQEQTNQIPLYCSVEQLNAILPLLEMINQGRQVKQVLHELSWQHLGLVLNAANYLDVPFILEQAVATVADKVMYEVLSIINTYPYDTQNISVLGKRKLDQLQNIRMTTISEYIDSICLQLGEIPAEINVLLGSKIINAIGEKFSNNAEATRIKNILFRNCQMPGNQICLNMRKLYQQNEIYSGVWPYATSVVYSPDHTHIAILSLNEQKINLYNLKFGHK